MSWAQLSKRVTRLWLDYMLREAHWFWQYRSSASRFLPKGKILHPTSGTKNGKPNGGRWCRVALHCLSPLHSCLSCFRCLRLCFTVSLSFVWISLLYCNTLWSSYLVMPHKWSVFQVTLSWSYILILMISASCVAQLMSSIERATLRTSTRR